MLESTDPYVKQFVHAEHDGPVPFHYPGKSLAEDMGLKGASMISFLVNAVTSLGRGTRETIEDLGHAARFCQYCLECARPVATSSVDCRSSAFYR